jgi:plasmid replication initiation protein
LFTTFLQFVHYLSSACSLPFFSFEFCLLPLSIVVVFKQKEPDMTSSKSLVVKHNRLVEASYRLDLSEQRLVLLAIVCARESGQSITSETWLEVKASDYVQICGLTQTSGYKSLKIASDNLFHRFVQLNVNDPVSGKPSILKTRWVNACLYVEQMALVRLRLSTEIIPYVSDLESNFTSYQLKNVAQMTSVYAIRLYELLAQYRLLSERYLSLVELKNYLDANEPSYERIDNFRRKVLDKAVQQINQYTDLIVTCTPRREGRSIAGFDFVLVQKEHAAPTKPIATQAPKNRAKQQVASPPPSAYSLSVGERAMLRDLQDQRPDLTEEIVIQMAKDQGTDVFLLLSSMQNSLRKSTQK